MTAHEQDALVERLVTALKTTPPQQIFCKEHEAMKRRTWWQSVRLMTAIATVLGTCAASVWWVGTQSSQAATTAANAVTSMKAEFVDSRTFHDGQAAQDSKTDLFREDTTRRLDRVQQSVERTAARSDENAGMLKAIANKLNVPTQ